MGFITPELIAERDEQLLGGYRSPEQLRLLRHAAAEVFCDVFSLGELAERITSEVTRQFIKSGRVAMVIVSAPEVTEELHGDKGCARELLQYLQSYEPRTRSVDLRYGMGEGGLVLPRVLVTFQPMLTSL